MPINNEGPLYGDGNGEEVAVLIQVESINNEGPLYGDGNTTAARCSLITLTLTTKDPFTGTETSGRVLDNPEKELTTKDPFTGTETRPPGSGYGKIHINNEGPLYGDGNASSPFTHIVSPY